MARMFRAVVLGILCSLCIWSAWKTFREVLRIRIPDGSSQTHGSVFVRSRSQLVVSESALFSGSDCEVGGSCGVFQSIEAETGSGCFLGLFTLNSKKDGFLYFEKRRGKNAVSRLEQYATGKGFRVQYILLANPNLGSPVYRVSCANWVGGFHIVPG